MNNTEQILAALADGPKTSAQLRAETGLLQEQIKGALNGLKRRGLVLTKRPYKWGEFKYWTDKPQKWYLVEVITHEPKD